MEHLLNAIGAALEHIDQSRPQNGNFLPGIGPLRETQLVSRIRSYFNQNLNEQYPNARTQRLPDFIIPDMWAIEFKIVRPFGNNGNSAEHWSSRLLHPYPGNKSSIGDIYRLENLQMNIRKGIVVVSYEHQPAQISLDPLLNSFELIASDVCGFHLSNRNQVTIPNLIHPIHQTAKVFGWEILSQPIV